MMSVVLIAACSSSDDSSGRPVQAIIVQPSNISATYSYAGVVRSRYENPIAFRVGGKMISRLVEVGDTVHQGQLLAALDVQDLKLNLQNKEGQLRAAETDMQLAKKEMERYSPLVKTGVISASQFHQITAKYDTSVAHVQQVKSDYNEAQQQLTYANLYADYDGVVTAIQASPGQVVNAGQPIMQIARTGEKEIAISVPEQRIEQWHQKAGNMIVTLWAYPQKHYTVKIREIGGDADPATRTYTVKLTVLNADAVMRLGMTANVTVEEHSKLSQLTVPLTAVFYQDNQPHVWVINSADMRVQSTPITLGNYVGNNVGVTSGLKAGQWVVTAGIHSLSPGQKVSLLRD